MRSSRSTTTQGMVRPRRMPSAKPSLFLSSATMRCTAAMVRPMTSLAGYSMRALKLPPATSSVKAESPTRGRQAMRTSTIMASTARSTAPPATARLMRNTRRSMP